MSIFWNKLTRHVFQIASDLDDSARVGVEHFDHHLRIREAMQRARLKKKPILVVTLGKHVRHDARTKENVGGAVKMVAVAAFASKHLAQHVLDVDPVVRVDHPEVLIEGIHSVSKDLRASLAVVLWEKNSVCRLYFHHARIALWSPSFGTSCMSASKVVE